MDLLRQIVVGAIKQFNLNYIKKRKRWDSYSVQTNGMRRIAIFMILQLPCHWAQLQIKKT